MTIELSFYLFLVAVGLILCLKSIPNEKLYSLVTIIFFITYSAVIRFSGLDGDMTVYAASLKYDFLNSYYLREPIYWITSRYVYKILQSAELTFMFYDLISFIIILKVRVNLKLPQYFPYLLLVFFPIVMGMNNVYRQYLSYTLILYFLSLQFINAGNLKKYFFLLVAILTHNASAVFAPLAFIINDRNRISYKALASGLGIFILLPYLLDSKSVSESGEVGAGVYLIFLFILFLVYAASYKFRLTNINKKLLYMFVYMLLLLSMSILLMGSAQSKRIGMYCLIISLVPLILSIESNYKQKALMRVILFIILTLPTLIFSSSLQMLLTK